MRHPVRVLNLTLYSTIRSRALESLVHACILSGFDAFKSHVFSSRFRLSWKERLTYKILIHASRINVWVGFAEFHPSALVELMKSGIIRSLSAISCWVPYVWTGGGFVIDGSSYSSAHSTDNSQYWMLAAYWLPWGCQTVRLGHKRELSLSPTTPITYRIVGVLPRCLDHLSNESRWRHAGKGSLSRVHLTFPPKKIYEWIK